MKILQVCPSFYPCFADGGVVRAVYEISKELVSTGNCVTVYTTDGCSDVNADNKHPKNVEGVTVYYFKNISKRLKSKFNITNAYYVPWIARKEVKNFDVIHIHEHRTILAVFICHYARKYNVPYVVQAHGSVRSSFQKSLLKKIFDTVWGYKILNNASKIIALTEKEVKQYKTMGIHEVKIEIVPNGINLIEYSNLPERGIFKNKHNLRKNEKIILYLGRIHKTKGIDVLISVFPDILNHFKQKVKLIIAGPDDGNLDYLKDLSKNLSLNDKILFVGPLYDHDKLEAYVDADVFITPTFSGFPLTFLESCACGTPIIMTNRGDYLNWVDNVGFITKNDIDFKNNIIKILSDKDLNNKFSKNGKKLVKEKFNWEIITKKLFNIYNTILG